MKRKFSRNTGVLGRCPNGMWALYMNDGVDHAGKMIFWTVYGLTVADVRRKGNDILTAKNQKRNNITE